MRILSPADYRVVPWKNGGGMTTDIAVSPEIPYRWRASRANVDRGGPFSDFTGYDRHLCLLSGEGMRLTFADRVVELREPLSILHFRGEESCECALLGGPVVDFNWVLSREYLGGDLVVVARGTSGVGRMVYAVGDTVVEVAGETIELEASHAVLLDGNLEITNQAGAPLLVGSARA